MGSKAFSSIIPPFLYNYAMTSEPIPSHKKIVIKPPSAVAQKHKKVLQKMSENVGKKGRNSISQAAHEAGYSESYARSGRLQRTKAWQQLLEQELPDEELMAVHKELLANEDWRARKEGLHFAYRIKKRYDKDLNINHTVSRRSVAEIDAEIAEVLAEMLEELANNPEVQEELNSHRTT